MDRYSIVQTAKVVRILGWLAAAAAITSFLLFFFIIFMVFIILILIFILFLAIHRGLSKPIKSLKLETPLLAFSFHSVWSGKGMRRRTARSTRRVQ